MRNPSTDAPLAVRKRIKEYGGLNPFGVPNWRVCLAQHVIKKSAGILHDWGGGELSQFEVDARGVVHYHDLHPKSVRTGVFELPRYQHDGWIVERWMPAHIWGSREDWASHKAADGSQINGPYPNEGDYFMLHGPYDKIPEIGDIELAIRLYECERANRPRNFERAVSLAIRDEDDRRMRAKEKFIKDLEHIRKDIEAVQKGTSLSAQAVRQQLNAQLGITSHCAIL